MEVRAVGLAAACLAALASAAGGQQSQSAKASRPGEYRGYSEPVFDGYKLDSTYVTVRDGTRLAIDIFRPTRNGVVTQDRLPVLWMHSPYNRRPLDGKSEAEAYPGSPLSLVKYGYVVAVADFRGLYASFGKNKLYNNGEYFGSAWTDAYDITEWLARQSWSSGRIGMWGCSATGGSQLQAAATRPPSLRAIFPLSPNFDAYEFANYGGAPSTSQARPGSAKERDARASPVDGPDGQSLLAAAKAEHNDDLGTQGDLPFRDSGSSLLGSNWWQVASPSNYVAQWRKPGLAVYAAGNWDETNTKAAPALVYANMPDGRRKLLFGPHGHCGWAETAAQDGLSIQIEELRFFDYWLKGIENGVMSEPPVTYYTYNAAPGHQWRQAATWPLPNEKRVRYYLKAEQLNPSRPLVEGRDATVMGEPAKAVSTQLRQAPGGLVYQTPPLERALEVTGYPVVDLWMTAEASDADVVTEISDVAPDGSTRTYEMVGRLRASSRKLSKPSYDNLGLPWHSHLMADAAPLVNGAPAELRFGMMPMSYIFPAGHRIRLSVTFSNPMAPGDRAGVGILTGGGMASSIDLPTIPAD